MISSSDSLFVVSQRLKRMNMRSTLPIFLATAIMVFPALSSANMRGPRLIWQPPSFSLSSPQGNKLTVKKEKLNIDCDYDNCQVQAVYEPSKAWLIKPTTW